MATQLEGEAEVVVQPVADISATRNNPSPELCNNSTVSISISNPNMVGGTYRRTTNYENAGHTAPATASNQLYGNFSDQLSNGTNAPITVTYTFIAVSVNSGCEGTPVQVAVVINPNPTITCPASKTVGTDFNACTAVVNGIDPSFAPATCNGAAPNITYTFSGVTPTPANNTGSASGKTFNKGTTTVTYNITDAAGNTGTPCSFTVRVNDTQGPVFGTVPSNTSINNDNNDCGAIVTYPAATATDNCGGPVNITYSQASGTRFPVGTTTVLVTATDNATPANSTTYTFTVTVNDTQIPVITSCPSVAPTASSAGTCGTIVNYPPATATDNCAYTITYSQASGTYFPVGTTPVIVTAKDASNNTATCTFNVVVTRTGGIYVNDTYTAGSDVYTTSAGNNTTGTGTKCSPYATVQKAIDEAMAGDSIYLDAGNYTENLSINKNLIFQGAQAGVAGTGDRPVESTLLAPTTGGNQLFSLSGTGTTAKFDGFKFDGKNIGAVVDGSQKLYIRNTIAELDFSPASNNLYSVGDSLVLTNNLFKAEVGTNDGSSSHIFVGSHLVARGNTFSSADALGQLTNGTTSLPVWLNVTTNTSYALIDSNAFSTIDIGVLLGDNASGVTISNNDFMDAKRNSRPGNSGNGYGAGIALFQALTGSGNSISNNNFTNSETGIRSSAAGAGPFALPGGLGVHYNLFTNITDTSIRLNAVFTGTLDATCNWFGTTSANGVDATTSNQVVYTPYLLNGSDANPTARGFQTSASCNGTPVVIAPAVSAPETCGGNNGSITVTFNGGTSLYTISYTRTNPSTPSVTGSATTNTSPYTIPNLPAGTYNITVTDANNSFTSTSATVIYNPVTNVTQMMTYTTIQGAVNAANAGDSITVCSGTYNEQVAINKALKIQGLGPVKPIINYTGVAANTARATLFDVTAANVTIRGFDLRVNLTRLGSAIIASAANISNLTVQNNDITPYLSTAGSYATAYGLRNAVSINYGGLRVNSSNPANILATGNTINLVDNGTPANLADDIGFRSGFGLDEGSGTFDNNVVQTISQDIQARFTSVGDVVITNNTIKGGGIEIAENNAGANTFSISDNTFNGTYGSTYSSALRLKNNINNKVTTVTNNIFTGHNWGISLENYRAVTVDNNVFTPAASSTNYRHITVNTKEGSSSSGFFAPNINGIFTKNNFSGSGSAGGLGLAFYNQDNDSPVVGPFTIGTAGNENNFNSGIGTFIYLDNTSGTTTPNATPTVPFSYNLDATNNKFDVGAGLQLPSAMSLANLFLTEDKVQHRIDTATLGFVLVKANNTFITTNSFVAPSTIPFVQRAIDAAATGFTVNVANGVYDGDVNVNKTVIVRGQSQAAVLRGLYAGNSKSVRISAANAIIKNVTITRDYGVSFNSNPGNDWASSTKTEGFIAENVNGFTLDSVLITGNRNGVLIFNSPGFVIKNSIIRDNRTGFQIFGNLNNGQIINNFITNNFTHGLLVNFDQGNTTGNNLKANNNNISGNWYSQINFQNNGTQGTNVGDFSGSNFNCNWYGSLFPVYEATNPSAPGYDSQSPSQFGGMDPNVNSDIRGKEAALITYKPYLNSGVDSDNDSLSGFQPVGTCVAPPNELYVNDGSTTGDTYTTAVGNDNNLGTAASPFRTMARALGGASDGNIIYVDAGTYAEYVTVNKAVSFRGAQYGIDPRPTGVGVRPGTVGESIIVPPSVDTTNAGGTLFTLGVSSISFDGFTFNGNNPALTGGQPVNGVDIQASRAFINQQSPLTSVSNIIVRNNVLKNFYRTGFYLQGVGPTAPQQSNVVDKNAFDNIHRLSNTATAVYLEQESTTDVTNNLMTRVGRGAFTATISGNATVPFSFSNNNITSYFTGIWVNNHYGATPVCTIANNTLATVSGATANDGIRITSMQTSSQVLVSNNIITPSRYGYYLWNCPTTSTITLNGGSVTGGTRGVNASNIYPGFGDASASNYIVDNVSIQNSSVASIYVDDNNANANNAAVSVTIRNSTQIGNPATGLLLNGANASASFSGAAPAAFSGQAKYIAYQNNGTDVPTVNIDATAVNFEGNTGVNQSLDNLYNTEDKINHKIDLVSLGFVTVNANNTYVTPNSFIAPNTTPSVQRGVDAASANFSVNVKEGTYNDNLVVNKNLTFFGAQRDSAGTVTRTIESILVAPASGNSQLFSLSGNGVNVTFDGFKIQGKNVVAVSDATQALTIKNTVADLDFSDAANNIYSAGSSLTLTRNLFKARTGVNPGGGSSHIFSGAATLSVTENKFTSADATNQINGSTTSLPVWLNVVDGTQTAQVSKNLFDVIDIGVLLSGTASGVNINSNDFSNAKRFAYTNDASQGYGAGIALFQTITGTGNSITNNNFTNSETGIRTSAAGSGPYTLPSSLGVHDNSFTNISVLAIRATSAFTGTLDATCNWFGTNDAAVVATKVSPQVNYIPYRSDGADGNPAIGFQPTSMCNATAGCTETVTATATQTQSTCAGSNDGVLTVSNTSGGTGPYTYTISGPANTTGASSGVFTGLGQGTYTITVYQATGCSTALAPVIVKDQIAPQFSNCPAPVTAQPVNRPNCQGRVNVPAPAATDNCTAPVITYVMSGATQGSGTAPIGTFDFNTGTTIIVYTATDQSGNTATCSTSVQVINTLRDSISGTATVVQNVNTTSNITFYGSGGTGPYTFYYKVNGGPTQSVSTTGNSNVVTVPQSNAVAGQYIYTLTGGTDTYGCAAALPADPNDTITVTTTETRPDLISSVDRPLNSTFQNGVSRDGYVTISNVASNPTTGTITFRISNLSNFNFTFPAGNTTPGGQFAVNNNDWTITSGSFFTTVTSKPGVTLAGGTSSRIGFQMSATGNAGSQGVMTVTILNGTGGSNANNGDSNSTNNQSVKLFTIN